MMKLIIVGTSNSMGDLFLLDGLQQELHIESRQNQVASAPHNGGQHHGHGAVSDRGHMAHDAFPVQIQTGNKELLFSTC